MTETNFHGKIKNSLSVGKEWAKEYGGSNQEVKNKIDGYLIPLESLKLLLNQDFNVVKAYRGNNDEEQILWFFSTKLCEETGIYIDFFSNTSSLFGDSDSL